MKKITFNAPLNHKAYSYESMKIEVEKIIPLYGKRFEQMRDHPLEDAPEIIENKELMYMEPEEKHRGLMVYYDANSPVNEKVVSAFPSVEVRNGELVGVLTCRLTEPLTESEMAEFKSYWAGQCSDGWGEGYEQQEIKTDEFGTIYVSFWNSSDSWQIEVEMMDETNDIEEEESFDMSM